MKLTNKVALISGLGCLALVGSGFAAWTFTSQKDSITENEAAAVASVATDGKINVTASDLNFVLDEDTASETTAKLGKLTWSGSLVFGWKNTVKMVTTSKITYTVVVTIPSGMSDYVKLTDGSNKVATKTYTYANKALTDTVTFDTADFAPVQNAMPQTETAYWTMAKAFAKTYTSKTDGSITVTEAKTVEFAISAAVVD